MNYTPEDIRHGQRVKAEAVETPSSFSMIDGSAQQGEAPKNRMAGPMGERAMQMMNDPNEMKRTQNWLQMFGMSNEGMQFNQAKMMMSAPQPQQQQEQA
jgi:hypothetical protein